MHETIILEILQDRMLEIFQDLIAGEALATVYTWIWVLVRRCGRQYIGHESDRTVNATYFSVAMVIDATHRSNNFLSSMFGKRNRYVVAMYLDLLRLMVRYTQVAESLEPCSCVMQLRF